MSFVNFGFRGRVIVILPFLFFFKLFLIKMYFVLYLILSLISLTKLITMTLGEREQKIIEMMQKICIKSMTGNLFEKKGLQRLQESLEILNELPVDKEKYSRLNSCHSFLQEMNEEYLKKTIFYFEEK